jgi:beta-lactamase superfamily II metal-dependent hydrolase
MRRFALACLLILCVAVSSAAAQTLRVYAIDCGQGSSTLIVGPTGISILVDGGPDQAGWDSNPNGPGPVALAIAAAGIAQLDYTLLTHYHSDHYEGLTELVQHNYLKPNAKAYDRGNVPAPENGFTTAINAYISAMGAKRTTITAGTVIDLGGGATLKALVVAGVIAGGPTIGTSGSAQEENSNSIGLLLEYNNFQLWVGGDLTGGGGGTTNVEGPVAPFAGDVDVYIADHHGSSTSSNATFLNTILPEFALASCGLSNPYSHPSTTFLNNTNKTSRSILTYATSGGTDGDGFGNRGFVNAGGTIKLETNGIIYIVTPAIGQAHTIACDEVAAQYAGAQFNDLRISEFMADPVAVPDDAGEWFEFHNVSGFERNLAGLKISQSNGSTDLFTFATPVLLKPGRRFVVTNNGDSQRNGGFIADHCEPFSAFTLDTNDSILLRNAASQQIDSLTYSSSFPDAAGVAAQRINLLGSTSSISNWAAATAIYGSGDKGTPGGKNTADATIFPAQFVSANTPTVGGLWIVNFVSFNEPGEIYLGAISPSNLPPFFDFYGHTYPLQTDPLIAESFNFPGFLAFLDAEGYASTGVPVPNDPILHGFSFYGAVGIYDFPTIAPGKMSGPVFVAIP